MHRQKPKHEPRESWPDPEVVNKLARRLRAAVIAGKTGGNFERECRFLEKSGWLSADERELWHSLARNMLEACELCSQNPVN